MGAMPMMRRAAAAFALALAGLGVVAGPAHADAPTIRVDTPSTAAPLTNPIIHVSGLASMPSGGTVTQIKVEVASLNGHGGNSQTFDVGGNPVQFSWDYTTTWNGTYRVSVTATGNDGPVDTRPGESRLEQRDVAVEAKPAAPTGFTAKVNKSRDVTLAWSPNGEPDLLGYQVQRRTGADTAWTAVVNTTNTIYTDTGTTSEGGTYVYRVFAVRSAATSGQAVVSDPSAERSVSVPDPPPTTTTTSTTTDAGQGGGSGGGGSGGGSGGGGGGTTPTDPGSSGSTDSPELARTGKVDLASFAGLLQAAERPTPPGAGTGGRAKEDDGTFEGTLPFKQGDDAVGEDGTALGVGVHEAGGEAEGRKPIAFVAASLLVTVILMHLLWLKREVERVPLPAETPGN